jgi:predicted nucleic acid-binding protein
VIVIDTNVLSEPLRPRPSPRVMSWLAGVDGEVFVTSITVGEILRGVRMLPDGRRRRELWSDVEALFSRFRHRVLDYDFSAAERFAQLYETQRKGGRTVSVEDGMIAAICLVHGARLATRNTRDFEELGLELVDPWGE